MKKWLFTFISSLIALIALIISSYFIHRDDLYKEACRLLNEQRAEEASGIFIRILDYKDSRTRNGICESIIEFKKLNPDIEDGIDKTASVNGNIHIKFYSIGTQNDDKTISQHSDSKYITETSDYNHYFFYSWKVKDYLYEEDTVDVKLTLAAYFKYAKYEIVYSLGEGFIVDAPTHYFPDDGDVEIPNPYRKGYTFAGWIINGKENEGVEPYVIKDGTNGNLKFEAKWTPNKYKATFVGNGGTVEFAEKEYTYDDVAILPNAKKDYYDFAGWYTEDNKLVSGKWNIDSDVTLYAHYNAIEYTINYNLPNDARFLDDYLEKYTIETNNYKVPYPLGNNKLFCGWIRINDDNDRNPVLDYQINEGMHGDITMAPLWVEASYSLGGISISDIGNLSEKWRGSDDYYPYFVIPSFVKEINGGIFNCYAKYKVSGFKVSDDNESLYTDGSFLLSSDKKTLYAYAFNGDNVETLIIPDEVENIVDNAFDNGDNELVRIRNVKGNNVKSIGENAFMNNTYLLSIDFPKLTTALRNAFNNCNELNEYNTSFSNIVTIGETAFFDTAFTVVELPESLHRIGAKAFGVENKADSKLTSFTILGDLVFDYSTIISKQYKLEELYIGYSTTSIRGMFADENENYETVPNLNLLRVDDGRYITEYFLYDVDCTNLNVIIDSYVESVGKYAFYNVNFGVIPEIVEDAFYIGDYAFSHCERGTDGEIVFSHIRKIGKYAFSHSDDAFTKFVIPDSCSTIGYGALYKSNVTELTLPINAFDKLSDVFAQNYSSQGLSIHLTLDESNTDIEEEKKIIRENTFQGFLGLTNISIGEGITLSQNAFKNCYNLTIVNISSTITEIPDGCFQNCEKLTTITAYIYNNDTYSHYKGNIHNSFENKEDKRIVFNTIKKIGDSAFYNCKSIKHVCTYNEFDMYEPNYIHKVGGEKLIISKYAFANCFSLSVDGNGTINIFNAYIDEYAFENDIIEKITINSGDAPNNSANAFTGFNGIVVS